MGVDCLKKILFLTGTRADFGKMKPLIKAVDENPQFDCTIFITGMHTLSRYGYTIDEVHKSGFDNTHVYMNQIHGEPMEIVLSNTIQGLSRFMYETHPDLVIVHGDRVEALAGAITGALQKILVAHIEGGEISGTVDGIIRHAITRLSHLHFVANNEAGERLVQLGEDPNSIHEIGSPESDTMLSKDLPDLTAVKEWYEFDYDDYAIAIFHPVTTEIEKIKTQAEHFVSALLESNQNYIVIYPNNDTGNEYILDAYKRLESHSRFKIFPSMRFEYYLSMLKNALFVIGNSSSGIREAPVYAVPSINIGNRQNNRFHHKSIINVDYEKNMILEAISRVARMKDLKACHYFGDGNSVNRFMAALSNEKFWLTSAQKEFHDIAHMV